MASPFHVHTGLFGLVVLVVACGGSGSGGSSDLAPPPHVSDVPTVDGGGADASPAPTAPPPDGGSDAQAPSSTAHNQLPPNPAGIKHVFVTANPYSGNLKSDGGGSNGLEGADNICAAEAQGRGYPFGTWTAFLSGIVKGTTINAIDRLTFGGPWSLILQDDQIWINAKAELKTTTVTMPGSNNLVWTATKAGLYAGPSCQGPSGGSWEVNDEKSKILGVYGSLVTPGKWSYEDTGTCSQTLLLYCFEQ